MLKAVTTRWVVIGGLLSTCALGNTYDSCLTIPLHFSYNQGGTPPTSGETDWHTLPWIPPIDYKYSGSFSDLPFTFDFGAFLHVDYNEDDFWIPEAGTRTANAQAWISSYDQPDRTELTSDLGFSFGISLRPSFLEWPVVTLGKDFQVNIGGNGELPLGDDNMLGGMDLVDLASIPLDQLASGSQVAEGAVSTFFNTLDGMGVTAFSISLMGEMVMHGNSVNCILGGESVAFPGLGPSNAVPITLSIPHDLEENFLEVDPMPDFKYDLYMGSGNAITIVDPLTFSHRNTLLERGMNCYWQPYSPPSLASLEASYDKVIGDDSVLDELNHVLVFPMKSNPRLPDMSIDWIAVNPEEDGNAFAEEWTQIKVTVSNWGRRPTVTNSWLKLRLWAESGATTNALERLINSHIDSSFKVFEKDESQTYTFYTKLPAGTATLRTDLIYYEVENAYWEYGAMQYDTVFAEENMNNNLSQRSLFVYPERGAIEGELETNPDPCSLPIDDILIEVEHVHGTTSTVTDASGRFEFGKIPDGPCRIHVLPEKPADPDLDPWWTPKSYCYYHNGNGVDRFYGHTQLEFDVTLYQFQKLTGVVLFKETPVSDAKVTIGTPPFLSTTTDRAGEFWLDGVPPRSTFTLNVYHQGHETLRGEISSYVDSSLDRSKELEEIKLSPDTNCPTMNVTFPDENHLVDSDTEFILETYDFDKPTEQMQWQVWDKAQEREEASSGWQNLWISNGCYQPVVTATVDMSTLSDGDYWLNVHVRDVSENKAASSMLPFTIDTTAPSPVLSIDGGADVTSDDIVRLAVTLNQDEPGPLSVEFSNDQTEWSDPIHWLGDDPLVLDTWKLTGEAYEELNGTVTVYTRVTDTLGHSATAQDDIYANAIGAMTLAGGAVFWPSNRVPFTLDLPPGQSQQLWSEPDPFCEGHLLDLGDQVNYAAQKIVLSSPVSISYVEPKFATPPFAGTPDTLHIKLVSQLDPADPTCSAHTLAEWSGPASQATNTPICFNTSAPASNTVYLLAYSLNGDTSNFYTLCMGTTDPVYGGNGEPAYQYTPSGWEEIPPFMEPYPSTLVLNLGFQDNGMVQVAGDGTCDTEPWHEYPGGLPAEVTVPADGVRTVTACRKYSDNTTENYSAAIVVDTLPPTGSVTIDRIDTDNRLIYATCQVNESGSGVSTLSYKTSFGWKTLPYDEELIVRYYNTSFDALQVYYTDRAGNSGPVCQALIQQDIFPPQLDAWFNAGGVLVCTREIVNTLHLDATDMDSPITHARWDEQVSGTTSGWIRYDDTIPIEIPFYLVNDDQRWNDGEYRFYIQVRDAAGNVSPRVLRKLILDREPPLIKHFYLKGQNAPGYTDNKIFYMNFLAWDAFPYPLMKIRTRINGGSWSVWRRIHRTPYQILVDCSAFPAGTFHADMEVEDAAGNKTSASTWIPYRRPPNQPVGISPDGTRYHKSQVLTATAFSDPDWADYMRYSWWRLRNGQGSIVYDSGPLGTGSQHLLKKSALEYDQSYTWEVQYTDKDWLHSPWSEKMEFVVDSTDLDGDGLPDGWEIQQFGDTRFGAEEDVDGDGACNGEEFMSGTSASDSDSVLRITGVQGIDGNPHQVLFDSVPGALYALDFCTDLSGGAWTQKVVKAADFPGNSTVAENTVHSNAMHRGFYRIRLQEGP